MNFRSITGRELNRRERIAASRVQQNAERLRAKRVGRPGVSQIQRPAKPFLLSTAMPDFETQESSIAENKLRIGVLRKVDHPGDWGRNARDLADTLEYQNLESPYPSLANSLYMRERRNCVIGSLYELISEKIPARLSTFCVVREGWAFHPGELSNVDPNALLNQFRKNINDTSGKPISGWMFVVIEASFDPDSTCYQFHVHGVATGGYISALDKLRKRRPYKPWTGLVGIPDNIRPINISRKILSNMPGSIAYILKPYWKLRNAGAKKCLQGDEQIRSLLWLHRFRLEDITLLMNLTVRDGRVVPSNSPAS